MLPELITDTERELGETERENIMPAPKPELAMTRVSETMAIVRKKMINFSKIELMPFEIGQQILLPTEEDKMPDLGTNKATWISEPMTGDKENFLEIMGPLLEHQGFLLLSDMLLNLQLFMQKIRDMLILVMMTTVFSHKTVPAILDIARVPQEIINILLGLHGKKMKTTIFQQDTPTHMPTMTTEKII